ncbi:MAG: CoA transferase [Gammaproteobacteria bacterium]|nr:CoA transferase [Gammaproteobacteria bacterium]MDH3364113.1 CoA transferase [Gammaproteobacteria bacterium]MDH3482010.1 CoA transferase [Gammaproteobacteria bacterium]
MGPLAGIKIIELKGIGPGPYAGMLLADMGADVIVVERSSKTIGIAVPAKKDVTSRGKRSIAIDIKNPAGRKALLRLVEQADVLFESFRPGVAERLGFGPEQCHAINPALVYGRLTGWGQSGPLAHAAGHDINYISLTGALAAIGDKERPVPPLNLVGDYAGGGLFLVIGILAALLEARESGKGQVIDAAITDGSASLMSVFHGWKDIGFWNEKRYSNLLDGAAYHYGVYETADGKFVSIGALEPQFYALLVEKAGLDEGLFGRQAGPEHWPALKEQLAVVFRQRSRQQWCEILEGSDACFAPVLDFTEAPSHPHNQARGTYVTIAGVDQPAPAPRFSRSECQLPAWPRAEGADTDAVLRDSGFSDAEIAELRESGALT